MAPHHFVSIENLTRGTSAVILQVGKASDRLHELGLTIGTVIKIVKVAPLGDPIEIEVRGSRICVRKAECEGMLLEATS